MAFRIGPVRLVIGESPISLSDVIDSATLARNGCTELQQAVDSKIDPPGPEELQTLAQQLVSISGKVLRELKSAEGQGGIWD